MSTASHQLVRDFFAALSAGSIPDQLLTDDMQARTISGVTDKARYQGGVQLMQSLVPDRIRYEIVSLIAESDRAAAEVKGEGTLPNGDVYRNSYAVLFKIRDGRIAELAEWFDPTPIQEKLVPLMKAAMASRAS